MSFFKRIGEAIGRRAAETAVKDYFASDDFKTRLSDIIRTHPMVVFLQKMQARYMERAPGLTTRQAWEHARVNLVEFLRSEKIEVGHPDYDWSTGGANDLVDDDMSYWEADGK